MKLKFERRQYFDENYSHMWRIVFDTVTGVSRNTLFCIDNDNNNKVFKVKTSRSKFDWGKNTDIGFIVSHYQETHFKCEGRFTPVKGLKRCQSRAK